MSEKQKHTPGPWELGIDDHLQEVTSLDGVVCQLYEYGEIKPAKRMRNSEANARLIAAAPDLLEACINVTGEPAADMPYTTYEKLLQAIKKATGES